MSFCPSRLPGTTVRCAVERDARGVLGIVYRGKAGARTVGQLLVRASNGARWGRLSVWREQRNVCAVIHHTPWPWRAAPPRPLQPNPRRNLMHTIEQVDRQSLAVLAASNPPAPPGAAPPPKRAPSITDEINAIVRDGGPTRAACGIADEIRALARAS